MQAISDLYYISKVILNFMRMKPYEIIVFWIVGLMLILISGMCIVKLCGLDEKIELYYMAGCILAVSVSHITASIMEPLGKTFSMYKTATLCIYGVVVIVMAIICIKNGRLLVKGFLKKCLMNLVKKFKSYGLAEKALFIVIIIFCFYIMFNSMCRLSPGATDDGYYVVKTGMIIHDDSLHITNEQATNGMVHVPSFFRADASTWCTFLALIASSFGIDYAVCAHVAIVPFILMAAMATVSLIAKAMFNSTIPKLLFGFSFFLLAITAPIFATMTNDYWIFIYPWFGVSTLYIMIYFLIYCLLMLSKSDEYLDKAGFWIFATLSVTASMAMEVIAAYLIPCFVLMFGLPYIVMNRHKISPSSIFKISWMLLPILHSVIAVLMCYMNMPDHRLNGGENGGFNMALSSVSAWDTNQAIYWGITSQNIYTVLTIVALLLIKDKRIQRFFGWSFLTAVATFLNPLFYKFVCVHVSTEMVYYRLYWCIPNLLIIAYSLVEGLIGLSLNKKRAILIYSVFIIYIVGFRQEAYGNEQLTWPTNIKKLPNEYVVAAEKLLDFRHQNEKIYVLVPRQYCDYVRQYSLDIVYPLGRRSPRGDYKVPGSELSYFDLYSKVYSMNEELGELSDEDVSTIKSLGTQVIMFQDESEIPKVLQEYDGIIDEYGYHYILLQQL